MGADIPHERRRDGSSVCGDTHKPNDGNLSADRDLASA